MFASNVEPLDSPRYEELLSITRSLHLRQAMANYGKQRLMSHKIVSKTVNLNVKVLWFAPTMPMNVNNMYGNVSFTLDWSTALEKLGPYLYYIDQQENDEFIYSRVLLTNKEYEFLTPVDEDGHSMPMLKFENKHYAAIAFEEVKHVLEIGVQVDCNREKWLYMNCKIQANDHSSANTLLYPGGPYNSCICHKFNYFKNECPSPYKLQRTKTILEKRCPSMLRDGPAGTDPSTHIIPRTNKQVEVVNDADKVYDVVPDNDVHKIVNTATPRRKGTTKVKVVKRVPTVKPKTATPVTTPSSTTNMRTLEFTSTSVKSSNAASSEFSDSLRTSATAHREGTTKGKVVKRVPAVQPETIAPVPSLISNTNVKTLGFTSTSVQSSNAASYRNDESLTSSVGHSSSAISNNTASLETYEGPPSSSVGQFSGAISKDIEQVPSRESTQASFRTYGNPPSSSVGQFSGAISRDIEQVPSRESRQASFRTYGNPPSWSVGQFSGAISRDIEQVPSRECRQASFRTCGSPPSSSVGQFSGAISRDIEQVPSRESRQASFRNNRRLPSSSDGCFGRSSPENTSNGCCCF